MYNKNIIWHKHNITKERRAKEKQQISCVLWFTGLSGSGKSTIANALESRLIEMKKHTYLLDGDNIRAGLNQDLTFSDKDRGENIRRIGEVSKLFVDAGLIVLTAFISPFREDRKKVRDLFNKNEFIEIFVNSSLKTCELRDPKGLYRKAREGKISNFTGLSSPYEIPKNAEIVLNTDDFNIDENVEKVVNFLKNNGYIG